MRSSLPFFIMLSENHKELAVTDPAQFIDQELIRNVNDDCDNPRVIAIAVWLRLAGLEKDENKFDWHKSSQFFNFAL